ncbi:MAG: FecR family protein [Longimicrobiales bacterium]
MRERDKSSIDELIFRCLKGWALPEEEAELARWRALSADNEQHVVELAAVLGLAKELHQQTRVDPAPIARLTNARSTDQPVLSMFSGRGWQHSGARKSRPRRLALALGGGIAASAVVVFAFLWQNREITESIALAAAEYSTTTEPGFITLGDGSVVRLASNSTLRVVPHPDRREVWLEGRAFFAVAMNQDVPFIVQTASGRTSVLGTRFDVEARGRELRVIVVEGRVELATDAGEVELGANEISITSAGEAPRAAQFVDPQLLDWLDTFIVFQSTPLSEAAREIEARFGIKVRIADSALARETVTAWSNSRTAQDLLARICLAVNASCRMSDTLIVLERGL